MNGTCAICKFWEAPNRLDKMLGYCGHDRVQNDYDEFPDGLLAQGIYEDSAQVHTGPDFGCIHWRPKE